MKAAVYETFRGPVEVRTVPDPAPAPDGVILTVAATGVCRSDWHGWMGHDDDIHLPHVPGHELAGTVAATGKNVRRWKEGDRVTVPFVCGCGTCRQCSSGNEQVCDRQTQPGFTHWGSYAEYVALDHADINLVGLPDDVDFTTAASLGCRFATSFRAIVDQGRVAPGEWVAVHGCGGVGLSAVMIAKAHEARVIAVDIDPAALDLAMAAGADTTIDSSQTDDVVAAVRELADGGVQLSVDALGSRQTCFHSIACLAKRGRHVQVGLMAGDDYRPPLPMELVIANELEIIGSHGMPAHAYGRMIDMMVEGKLDPGLLIRQTVNLERAAMALGDPGALHVAGVTVIDRFSD